MYRISCGRYRGISVGTYLSRWSTWRSWPVLSPNFGVDRKSVLKQPLAPRFVLRLWASGRGGRGASEFEVEGVDSKTRR